MIQQDLFCHEVMTYKGCQVVMDAYREPWPRYDVYFRGSWIGCTNASNEASWKAAVRHIVNWYLKWRHSIYGE